MQGRFAAVVVLAIACAEGGAQSNDTTFEVADVHASAPGTKTSMGSLPNGRFEAHGYTLLRLIQGSYGISDEKIIGGRPGSIPIGSISSPKCPLGRCQTQYRQASRRYCPTDSI
jgi:hypothetical protein